LFTLHKVILGTKQGAAYYALKLLLGGYAIMAIKSVREISFFQSLRERELKLSFYNEVPNRTNEEVAQLTYYLVLLAKKTLDENFNSELMYMEKECIKSLFTKINPELLREKDNAYLTVIETIHLHNILGFYENCFEKFREFTKKTIVPHQLMTFILVPETYKTTIAHIKNNLALKLGEGMASCYKY
jgi:hypothetical protein